MVLRRIDPISSAKVLGILYALLGVTLGLFMALFGSLLDPSAGEGFGGSFGFAALLIFPFVYGFLGVLTGLVGALLYNLVAGWTGGIELDLDDAHLNGGRETF